MKKIILISALLLVSSKAHIIDWDQHYIRQQYPRHENYSLQSNKAYLETPASTTTPLPLFAAASKPMYCELAERACEYDDLCPAAFDIYREQCEFHESYRNSELECPVECQYAHVLLMSVPQGRDFMNCRCWVPKSRKDKNSNRKQHHLCKKGLQQIKKCQPSVERILSNVEEKCKAVNYVCHYFDQRHSHGFIEWLLRPFCQEKDCLSATADVYEEKKFIKMEIKSF